MHWVTNNKGWIDAANDLKEEVNVQISVRKVSRDNTKLWCEIVNSRGEETKIEHKGNIENVNNAVDRVITVWIQLKVITKRCLPIGNDKVQTEEEASNHLELVRDAKGYLSIQEQYQRKLLLLSLLEQ